VGATHIESSASQSAQITATATPIGSRAVSDNVEDANPRHTIRQSQARNHPLLCNGSVIRFPRRQILGKQPVAM
jgi:hypothetical protein